MKSLHRTVLGILGGTFAIVPLSVLAPSSASASTFTPLTLLNGWTNGPFATRDAAVVLAGGIVHLEGAIATTGTNAVAFRLPLHMRPLADAYIPVDLCNAHNGRLFIASSTGLVTVEAESAFSDAQCLTSLDGASYAVGTLTPLTLVNGWTSSPFSTGKAAAEILSGVVRFQGAIATSGTNAVPFTVPAAMRPAMDVYVPIDLCNAHNGRLYIAAATGVATVEAQTAFSDAQCFTSLDGASYALGTLTPLTLKNGWTDGPFGTSNAAVHNVGGIITFQGAIGTTGTKAVAFNLPPAFRPAADVYVPVDMCSSTNGRLIITASTGAVSVEAETAFTDAQCFTSLDGVSFAK